MICALTFFSTVFQSYHDDGRLIMKGCVLVYGFKSRAEYQFHSSIIKMNVLECKAECRTHSSIFKVV